jgi:sugar/nucleoside kinase (ribokinase family)
MTHRCAGTLLLNSKPIFDRKLYSDGVPGAEDNPALRQTPPASPEADTPDIAIAGELNPDLILYGLPEDLPPERELLASGFFLTLGSSSAILAHNLAAIGSKVLFISTVGDDLLGRLCREFLTESGVEADLRISQNKTLGTGVTVILPQPQHRRILTYPGTIAELRIEDLDMARLSKARHFHLSSLYLQKRLLPDVANLFRQLKEQGLSTSLDTNDDPESAWGPPLQDLLPHVDILFCNERELCGMTHDADPDQAARVMADKVNLLVVKQGAHGATAFSSQGPPVQSPGVKVPDVVDAVGAGDSFDAGFLHKYLRGETLETCLQFGNRTGALSVTRAGGVQAFRERDYARAFLNG